MKSSCSYVGLDPRSQIGSKKFDTEQLLCCIELQCNGAMEFLIALVSWELQTTTRTFSIGYRAVAVLHRTTMLWSNGVFDSTDKLGITNHHKNIQYWIIAVFSS